jgi:hypothetical protein
LACHVQPAIYDIDNDGNLEMITCFSTHPKVWDLGTWTLDATLTEMKCSEPPDFANVMGDSNLEIIACSSSIRIYDSTYTQIQTIPTNAYCSVIQDVDNDALNELIFLRNNSIRVYDTLALAPTPRVRTDTPYYGERRTDAGIYVAPIGGDLGITGNFVKKQNNPPNTPTINGPSSGKTGMSYNYTFISRDPKGDPISYQVNWGDGTVDTWYGPVESNVTITRSHTWEEKGTYTIKARVKDGHGIVGAWGTLGVTMPQNSQCLSHLSFLRFLQQLFERFPHSFPILRQLLGY